MATTKITINAGVTLIVLLQALTRFNSGERGGDVG